VLDTMYVRNAQMKNMRWNGRPQLYKNNVPLFDYVTRVCHPAGRVPGK